MIFKLAEVPKKVGVASMATTIAEYILGIRFTDGIECQIASSIRCRLIPSITKTSAIAPVATCTGKSLGVGLSIGSNSTPASAFISAVKHRLKFVLTTYANHAGNIQQ